MKFRVESGNSVTRSGAAQETYTLLSREQRERMHQLVTEQRAPFERAIIARVEMNRYLDRMRSGEPVERDEFLELGKKYGQAEAELGQVLAAGLGEVAASLTDRQRDTLADLRKRYVSGRAGRFTMPADVKSEVRHLDRASTQELWNVTSRLLTWVTGSSEDNDFETVGKPSQHFGFVSFRVESGHAVKRGAIAKEVLTSLTPAQRSTLQQVVREERSRFHDFLTARSRLCRELERALARREVRDERVAAIGREMGRIEASMTWSQANGILAVRDLLTRDQAEALLAMRAKYVPQEAPQRAGNLDELEAESALAAQITRGRQLFAQCTLCHVSANGQQPAAPLLNGIVGGGVAANQAYTAYSPALRQYAESRARWTEDALDAFLRSPRTEVPGTTMGFMGIDDRADRQALITYLKMLSK
ncbi:MAG: c-type cytochrome [Myxococcota bacterium]